MTENVQTSNPVVTEITAKEIVNSPELRKLRPGTDEFKAAADLIVSKKNEVATPAVTTTTSTQASKVDGESPTKVEDASKTKNKGLSKRIDEITKEKYAEKTRADALEVELKALKEASKAVPNTVKSEVVPTPPQASSVEFTTPKPDPTRFDDAEKYREALMDWKIEEREFKKEQASKVDASKLTLKQKVDAFLVKGKEIETEFGLEEGEFESLAKLPNLGDPVVEAELLDDPNGYRIMYDIASNEDEMTKFNAMSIAKKLSYIGKASAKFEKAEKPANNKAVVSKAKAPAPALKSASSSSTSGSMPDPKTDRAGWVKWRNDQRKAEGRKI